MPRWLSRRPELRINKSLKARLRRDCTTVLFAKNFTLLSSGKPEVFPFWENVFVSHKNFIAKKKAGHEEPAFQRGIKD